MYLIVGDIGSELGEGIDFIDGMTFLERFYTILGKCPRWCLSCLAWVDYFYAQTPQIIVSDSQTPPLRLQPRTRISAHGLI